MGRGGEKAKPQNENYWHVLTRRSKKSVVRKNTQLENKKGKIMEGDATDSRAAAAYHYGSCSAFNSLQKRSSPGRGGSFSASDYALKKGSLHDSNKMTHQKGDPRRRAALARPPPTASPPTHFIHHPSTPHYPAYPLSMRSYPYQNGGILKGVSYADMCRSGKGGQRLDPQSLPPSPIQGVKLPKAEAVSHHSGEKQGRPEAGSSEGGRPAPAYSASLHNRCLTPGWYARRVTTAAESSGGKGNSQKGNSFFSASEGHVSHSLSFGKGKRILKALDLFSGTGSVSNQLSKWGFQVTSLDNNPGCKADLCLDILAWDYKRQFPPGHFQVITASVPCEEYSSAKTTQVRDLGKADILAKNVLEIVAYFQPDLWWIENPRRGWLRHREFMQGLPIVDLDYCQFSEWGYQKPTRFWGSPQLGRLHNVLCDFKNCINIIEDDNGNWHHRERLGGLKMIYSTKDKWRVPSSAVDYLLGSTYKWENGMAKKFFKWQKAGTVRIQEIEKNEEDISDQGISDDDESNPSENASVEKEGTQPEKVWVVPKRMCKSWDSYSVNSLQKRIKSTC